jgi:hypothetical protein
VEVKHKTYNGFTVSIEEVNIESYRDFNSSFMLDSYEKDINDIYKNLVFLKENKDFWFYNIMVKSKYLSYIDDNISSYALSTRQLGATVELNPNNTTVNEFEKLVASLIPDTRFDLRWADTYPGLDTCKILLRIYGIEDGYFNKYNVSTNNQDNIVDNLSDEILAYTAATMLTQLSDILKKYIPIAWELQIENITQ